MLIEKDRFPVKDIILYGFLPGFLKKALYRLKGYRIGKNVRIGMGSVVCGSDVSIGDNTSIGFLSIIRGKSISIGSHVSIGSTSFLDTPHLAIGDGSKINEQVFVGGLQFPDSKLTLGRNCQIMQMTFINPARSITMGDDSGIGGYCLVFGHNSWLSRFEGYPVDFKPIEIGRSVSIAWRVFVLPGTKVGDGAVVGANSLVNREIPPRCLAVGYPARVVSRYPDFPAEVTTEEKVTILRRIVDEMISYFTGYGLPSEYKPDGFIEVLQENRGIFKTTVKKWKLQVCYEPITSVHDIDTSADVVVSLCAIGSDMRQELNDRGSMWIDIEQKERPRQGNDLGEEVVQYLRRYGVRFFRV